MSTDRRRSNRRLTTVALGTVVLGALIAALGTSTAHADEATLTGTVTDFTTGQPIADACVTVTSIDQMADLATECTGTDGRYKISITPGWYKVRAAKTGYTEVWAGNELSWAAAEPVSVQPDSPAVDFEIFHRTATVTGQILDPAGQPQPATIVSAIEVDEETVGRSSNAAADSAGRFRIDGLAPGRYQVLFNDQRYGQLWAYGAETREAARSFVLGDGGTIAVDDRFLPLGTAELTVRDNGTDAPVTNACVATNLVRVCAARDGVYRLELPPGQHWLSVDAGTHLPDLVSLDVIRGRTTSGSVRLTRAEAIVTRVVDRQTNRPVPNVCSLVVRDGSHGLTPYQRRHCSGQDGRLDIALHGAPGSYQVFLDSADEVYGAQWVGRGGGTGDQRLAANIAVPAGANVTIPDVKMDRPGTISGLVGNSDGTPAENVCAFPYASVPLPNLTAPNCTDSEGRYTIGGLGPYHWPVLFAGPTWVWSGDRSHRFDATMVRVQPGQMSTMDATIPAGALITGTAADRAGRQRTAHVAAYNAVTGDYAALTATAWPGIPYRLTGMMAQEIQIEYSINGTTCWYQATTEEKHAKLVAVTGGETTTLDLTGCG